MNTTRPHSSRRSSEFSVCTARSRRYYVLRRAHRCFFVDFKMSTLNAIDGHDDVKRMLGVPALVPSSLVSFGDQISSDSCISQPPRFASAIRAVPGMNPSLRSLVNFASNIVIKFHLPFTSFLIKLTSTAHRSGQGFYTPEPMVMQRKQIEPTFSGGSIKKYERPRESDVAAL